MDTLPWREIGALTPQDAGLNTVMRVYELRTDTAPAYNPHDFSGAEWLTPAALLARSAAGDPAKRNLVLLVRLYDGDALT
ncbi:hypothetical protein E0686_08575 [Deinococcus sp. S9]|nr:hypothetical protein E0686_08575 [Deinococcus sp. S9]